MTIASVNWEIAPITSYADFEARVESVTSEGDVVLLPENITYELLHLHRDVPEVDVPACLSAYADSYLATLTRLARSRTIVGGTTLVRTPRGIENVWPCATPEGAFWGGSKVCLTQYEIDPQGLTPGAGLVLLPDARLGVMVCYDSEFPEAARALAEAGVLALCVPAYTATLRGFKRVRWCCAARATENQVFVAHASLVGTLDREPVTTTYGSSAILTPLVERFPENATLARTRFQTHGVAIADLDFDALLRAREEGDVRNWHDRARGDWTVRRHR